MLTPLSPTLGDKIKGTLTGAKPATPMAPRKKARLLSETKFFTAKLMVYGPPGAGKTHSIVTLLQRGERVAVVETDLGGSGLLTVVTALKKAKATHLLENVYVIPISSYEEMVEFLENPRAIVDSAGRTIYDFGPTWVVWDGFSNFQLEYVSNHVYGMTDHKKEDSLSEAQADGLMTDQQGWGMIRRATMKVLSEFLRLGGQSGENGEVVGSTYNFLLTALALLKQVPGKSGEFSQLNIPMIQGQAGQIVQAGFDLVLRVDVSGEKRVYHVTQRGGKRRIEVPETFENLNIVFDAVAELKNV